MTSPDLEIEKFKEPLREFIKNPNNREILMNASDFGTYQKDRLETKANAEEIGKGGCAAIYTSVDTLIYFMDREGNSSERIWFGI